MHPTVNPFMDPLEIPVFMEQKCPMVGLKLEEVVKSDVIKRNMGEKGRETSWALSPKSGAPSLNTKVKHNPVTHRNHLDKRKTEEIPRRLFIRVTL